MKWLLFSILFFFGVTFTSYASYDSFSTPIGTTTSPVTMTVSFTDTASLLNTHASGGVASHWCIATEGDYTGWHYSPAYPVSQLSATHVFSLPIDYYGQSYYITLSDNECSETNYVGDSPSETAFAVISIYNPPQNSFSGFTTSTASDLIAGIGAGVRTSGANLWLIVAVAISIFLVFWLLENIVMWYNNGK